MVLSCDVVAQVERRQKPCYRSYDYWNFEVKDASAELLVKEGDHKIVFSEDIVVIIDVDSLILGQQAEWLAVFDAFASLSLLLSLLQLVLLLLQLGHLWRRRYEARFE